MPLQVGARSVEVELIVFDKDGTLVDLHAPWGAWAESLAARLAAVVQPEAFLARLGWDSEAQRVRPETPLAIAPVATVRSVIATWLYDAGLGWSAAVSAADRAVAEADLPPPAPPICDLVSLFAALTSAGIRVAVATTDERAGVERDLGPLGLLPYVSAIVGADAGAKLKPAPDAVLSVCESVGVAPTRTLVAGDSAADLMMGRAAGVALTVGVLSGSGVAETLGPYADVVVPNVCALRLSS